MRWVLLDGESVGKSSQWGSELVVLSELAPQPGKLSYGMYVFQAPLIPLVAALGWSAGVSLSIDLLYVGFMFALTVGVAWCSWHGFEKHWLRLKDYFSQSDIDPAKTSHQDCPNRVGDRFVRRRKGP